MYNLDKVRISKGNLSLQVEGPSAKILVRVFCFTLICIGLAFVIAEYNKVRYIG